MKIFNLVNHKWLSSKFKALGKNEENKELIRHSFLALIIRLGGAIAAFLMNIVVARYLGAEEAGYFFLAVTVTTLAASIARVGADQTILRFVSIHSENGQWDDVHAVMKKMISWTYIPVLFVTLIICLLSKPISIYLFHKPGFQWPLFYTSLSMPFFAAYNVYGMALQGRRKVVQSVTVLKVITPAFLILAILLINPRVALTVSVLYAFTCLINFLFGIYWWKKNVPKTHAHIKYDTHVLWESCGPLWISSIMQQVTVWGGQLVAGIFLKSSEVAQLAVARNITVLVIFILQAVNNVSSPRIAAMYSKGQMNKLKNYVRNTTWLMTFVSLPIMLFIWFFPSYIMSIFGKGFSESNIWILRVLAVGQFISVVTGVVGTLLVMCGFEKDMKRSRIINGFAAIILAFILTPLFGAVGSAVSSAVSIALFNLLCVRFVKKRLNFNTLSMFFK